MAYAIVCLHLNSPQERVWQKAYEMTARVLILSPDTGFGGLIQQTLERAGGYEPLLVSSGRQALDIARKVSFDLAILDADVTDMPINQLGDGLLRLVPDMRLILIPPEKPLPEFDGQAMRISGYLTKPFYLPDLVDIVERSLSPKPVNILPSPDEELQTRPRLDDEWQMGEALTAPVAPISAGSRLLWLEDVNQAAQTLARLSMASSAQAGLILREGRLWAYAGQLTQAAMQELANLVIQDWRGSLDAGDMDESHVDLARYILLKSTHQEYMLYTTLLEDHLLLALAFNAKMPFSEIRSQAASLVRALTSPPEKGLQFETQGDFSGSEANQTDFVAEEAAWLFDASGEEPQTPGLESATPVDASAEPVSEAEDIQQTRWIYEFAAEVEAGSKREAEESQMHPQGVEESLSQARELPSAPLPSQVMYLPVIADIHYTCVLLPRLPGHDLVGDLAQNLSIWMNQIALSFGWRLEYLDVHPAYVQWMIGVAPEISAEEVIKSVRIHTSNKIFGEYPRYQRENLGDDFWAPGYLVVSNPKSLSEEAINKFIHHTRSRQGLEFEK